MTAACALPPFGVFHNSDLGKFACYKHGDIVCQQIRSRGSWEMHHMKAFAPFMEPDFTFVDVGSNVGCATFSYSVRAALSALAMICAAAS